MFQVRVWTEEMILPTYEAGPAEKNPMFLEKRVYQGSSGKVYPYPITEVISDLRVDRNYTVVHLENRYLKVTVLPELGGRIQRAIDKTNNYDFVYYNQVIKPALVGLTGPWVSGGIEFNWPQHHRPSTFLPLNFKLEEEADGSASVVIHDVDRMNGSESKLRIALHPDKAYIELTADLYNCTALPQTFLWWANPAVPVGDHTQSIFPPDVHFVLDHGKRDVSRFPISRSTYYKKDYSEGVDISYYKNIPVPTSYMVEHSDYDFIGNYDHKLQAGLLHVADHHISPGKKQWTWGHGDFGQAWDRNLTDEDGPYIELMTGVYTDNQPDFAWLKPFESKQFKQYFMPYKDVGVVKNASVDAAIGVAFDNDLKALDLRAYASSEFESVQLLVRTDNEVLFEDEFALSPTKTYKHTVDARSLGLDAFSPTETMVELYDEDRLLVSYQEEPEQILAMPDPAKEPELPADVLTNEDLLFIGRHLEQVRHARVRPDAYYLEGLKRDPEDSRINTAYGTLLLRRGLLEEAKTCFDRAITRVTKWNLNPYNSEAYEGLGLSLFYMGRQDEAYDAFYKAAWTAESQHTAFYYLAAIDSKRGRFEQALEHIDASLDRQRKSRKALGLRAYILRKLGRSDAAKQQVASNLTQDPFDFVSMLELELADGDHATVQTGHSDQTYLLAARDYAEFGAYPEAVDLLQLCSHRTPLIAYYEAYYRSLLGEDSLDILIEAEAIDPAYCFPNALEDIPVLRFAIEAADGAKAKYYLGNLLYDRFRWEEAEALWEASYAADPSFPTVARNLSQLYANKRGDMVRAREMIEAAFNQDRTDVRVFMERDQLYRRIGLSFDERLRLMEEAPELLPLRDPLYVEYITMLNMVGRYEDAYEAIRTHRFHPWEGGEGKITEQYEYALMCLADRAVTEGRSEQAEAYLSEALLYPENLGEGKLEGTKDNQLYYKLGCLAEDQGSRKTAEDYFRKATLGSSEISPAMYYNDQPVDTILYQGLSHAKLGESRRAKQLFSYLIDTGEQRLDAQVKPDFFAVSLPEMTVYEDDEQAMHRANCYYMMALGYLGLEDDTRAKRFLDEALRENKTHRQATLYRRAMN